MKIIGLTGQSGAGKSEVAKLLLMHGIPHIDCDKVYHSLLHDGSDCTNELAAAFGGEILASDGSVDRKKLAFVVFGEKGSPEKLTLLNSITLKYVLDKCRKIIEKYKAEGKKAVTFDAPTLIESGFHRECDVILAVTAAKEVRLIRIMHRDGITESKALQRINSQPSESFYTEQADFIIENNYSEKELREQTEKFIREKLN